MGARLRSWWQQIKQHRIAIGVGAIVCVVVIVIIIIGYQFDWTGFNGYTKVTTTHIISGTNAGTITKSEEYQPGNGLWDWLGLLAVLAIPVVVGLGTVLFTSRQAQASEANRAQQTKESEANREKRHQTDLEIAEKNREREQETAIKIAADNQHEAAFRAYLDKMSELLIDKNLATSARYDQVRKIARVQTLAVLLGLDPIRKRYVLQFLYESRLINADDRIVDLSNADLQNVDLSESDLTGADLSRADLSGANLFHTNLEKANLFGAILKGAILETAGLEDANLENADLRGANLELAYLFGAYLRGADLRGTNITNTLVEEEALYETLSLEGATMPDGFIHS